MQDRFSTLASGPVKVPGRETGVTRLKGLYSRRPRRARSARRFFLSKPKREVVRRLGRRMLRVGNCGGGGVWGEASGCDTGIALILAHHCVVFIDS